MRAEEQLQQAVVKYLKVVLLPSGSMFFHIPNQRGTRTLAEMVALKSLGVIPGVADLGLIVRGGMIIFIELKTAKGRLTSAQKAFKQRCDDFNVPYHVCRSIDEVGAVLLHHRVPTRLTMPKIPLS